MFSRLGLAKEGDHRTCDIVVVLGGKLYALDVTISSPLQKDPSVSRKAAEEVRSWAK